MGDSVKSVKKYLDIIEYWHRIEFFIPFDLKQVLDKADEGSVRWLGIDDLAVSASLPLWHASLAPGKTLRGFKLYLGVFEMSEIAAFAQQLPMPSGSGNGNGNGSGNGSYAAAHPIGEAERTELDGRSCMASIQFDAQGHVLPDHVRVSSAPWAMAQVARSGLTVLSAEHFAAARKQLADLLFNFEAERSRRASQSMQPRPSPLDAAGLLDLYRLLVDWSDYTPAAGSPLALLEILTTNADADVGAQASGTSDLPIDSATAAAQAEAEATSSAVEPTVEILNSFYIEDLEQCRAALQNGATSATVQAYLGAACNESRNASRIDLYTAAGREVILEALHPRRFNTGHWLADASQKMSLMQQFALNSAFELLQEGGLYAVNGPPGTGKTTLLRDMMAENVVRRARRLAALPNAADAISRTPVPVSFAGRTVRIRALREELSGFEMVVASSNNAAVENISRELPQRSQIGAAWHGTEYLQPVAHKIAAQKDEGDFRRLAPGEVPWGLFSCVLGRAQNRRRFARRFYFDDRPATPRTNAHDPKGPCTIRDWLAWPQPQPQPSFSEARHAFIQADAAVRHALEARARYADLAAELAASSETAYLQRWQVTLDAACATVVEREKMKRSAESDLEAHQIQLAHLLEEERLIDRAAPGFLSRLFGTVEARRHLADVAANALAQRQVHSDLRRAQAVAMGHAEWLSQAQIKRHQASVALEESRAQWHAKQDELAVWQTRFAEVPLPPSPDALESDVYQIQGLWQDAELSALRSALFAAALALHQAWLAEVAVKGGPGFGGNLLAIQKMLSGVQPDDPEHVRLIWQSLFMVVPVVSTTFASFARQFRDMGQGSIGWLFIDEAGQATPQAALGALWRAQRALVVGDPLQIEPVLNVPSRLIHALSQQSPHTADGRYSPARVSVQRLADEANRYGTWLPAADDDEPLWIGSPLRVHRRCAEPMFSISNQIAYRGKMVYGRVSGEAPADRMGLGASAWVDVRGAATQQQAVERQTQAVLALVTSLYVQHRALPAFYLISPFKAVRNQLQQRLLAFDWSRAAGIPVPSKAAWKKWCSERIGTVHTFQGKEEEIVILVLGADQNSLGAANWAAATPNLLNVALTRAQHRVYVLGDVTLWGGLRHFSQALPRLRLIPVDVWLAQCDAGLAPLPRTALPTSPASPASPASLVPPLMLS
ncbi:DEAD/DEAH box helicase [Paraburkholderia hayleyella]|uniref:DEAD/DEAH box helicase n=1 Tax=Paraburkholderia hayleyella TaxID=2152889 RepID=UPI001580F4E9|nr:AAA domain-containing protein [Paraburkholderia hayleyella]